MLFLVLQICAQTGILYAMRLTDRRADDRRAVMFINYVVCAALSFILMDDKALLPQGFVQALLLAFFNSFAMVAGLYFNTLSIRDNGTAMSGMFAQLGAMIPTVLSVFFFDEIPGALQITGIAVAVSAIVIINTGSRKERGHIHTFAFLIAVFLINGIVNFDTKLFDSMDTEGLKDHYTFYTFAFCALISLTVILAGHIKPSKGDIKVGVMIGIPNMLSLAFALQAVGLLPAFIVFPAVSAGTILAVTVINYFVLHDPLSKREKITMGLVVLSLVLINI